MTGVPPALLAKIDTALEQQPLTEPAATEIDAVFCAYVYPFDGKAWPPRSVDCTHRFFQSAVETAPEVWSRSVAHPQLQWCWAKLVHRHRVPRDRAAELTWDAYTDTVVDERKWVEKVCEYGPPHRFPRFLGQAFYWRARTLLGSRPHPDTEASTESETPAPADTALAFRQLPDAVRSALSEAVGACPAAAVRRSWLVYGCGSSPQAVAAEENVDAIHPSLKVFCDSFLPAFRRHWPYLGLEPWPGQPGGYARVLLAALEPRLPVAVTDAFAALGELSTNVRAALSDHWGRHLDLARTLS